MSYTAEHTDVKILILRQEGECRRSRRHLPHRQYSRSHALPLTRNGIIAIEATSSFGRYRVFRSSCIVNLPLDTLRLPVVLTHGLSWVSQSNVYVVPGLQLHEALIIGISHPMSRWEARTVQCCFATNACLNKLFTVTGPSDTGTV